MPLVGFGEVLGDFKRKRAATEGKQGWQDESYTDKHAPSKQQQFSLFFLEEKDCFFLQN